MKFRNPFARKASPAVPPAEHEHNFFELPCDMGRQILRSCRTEGCDYRETVPATAAQRESARPAVDAATALLGLVTDDVERERGRRNRR